MADYFGFNEIKALEKLIIPEKDDTDSDDDDLPQAGAKKFGPGQIGPIKNSNQIGPHASIDNTDSDDIWNNSEIKSSQTVELSDPRIQPEYEMKFKQSVTTEDVFLGMGFKTPGSASCEWLTLKVKLPGEDIDDIELSVETETIDIRSKRYRLHLPTPHPVDPNASSAKWHKDLSCLEINLRMTRELDKVNF
ncbi:hypothetical protein HCN44_009109 [Aphidius gifuensis]|uniref:CS domain-containing protein n=1 Tax=Aphidius gifuensis TaxID=684658 RepID=A0A834Y549_APHGI|nr:dynein axonemal assembly factor 6-like [Aphidius gifuensis]XP_044015525.1 dynein axonemal assembly factor 6-like [Aphidius gifuensis]KAF7996967.1 hypothetical protein HCN44_005244 [Aphidius gifuensis]KAF7997711.1 hypothetical protein HCN44_009109 [Aphidius gifuensis]